MHVQHLVLYLLLIGGAFISVWLMLLPMYFVCRPMAKPFISKTLHLLFWIGATVMAIAIIIIKYGDYR